MKDKIIYDADPVDLEHLYCILPSLKDKTATVQVQSWHIKNMSDEVLMALIYCNHKGGFIYTDQSLKLMEQRMGKIFASLHR